MILVAGATPSLGFNFRFSHKGKKASVEYAVAYACLDSDRACGVLSDYPQL